MPVTKTGQGLIDVAVLQLSQACTAAISSLQQIIQCMMAKIEIEGIDWYGFQTTNYLLTYNYENGLSNGIKNYLTLTLINNQKMKIQFQKNYPCEFSEIEDIIKHYYKNDKIYLSNCLQILCLDTKEKVDNFER